MLKRVIIFMISLAISAVATGNQATARTNERFAYIVGNEKYESIKSLKNPKNDATEITKSLTKLNFRTQTHLDQTISKFDVSFDKFLEEVSAAKDRGSVVDVVFYYAGHGIEQSGANYLLPTDFDPIGVSPSSVRRRSISLDELITRLSLVSNRVIVILDSCRDDPFSSVPQSDRGAIDDTGANSKYVMPREIPIGVIIFYCAGLNQRAKDSLPTDPPEMRNGVCTRHILEVLNSSPSSFEMAANQIQLLVDQTTNGSPPPQTPAIYDQLVGTYDLLSFDEVSAIKSVSIAENVYQDIKNVDAGQIASLDLSAKTSGMAQYFETGDEDDMALERLSGLSLNLFFNPERLAEAQALGATLSDEGALVNIVPTDFSELGDVAVNERGKNRIVHTVDLTARESQMLGLLNIVASQNGYEFSGVEVKSLATGPIQIQMP